MLVGRTYRGIKDVCRAVLLFRGGCFGRRSGLGFDAGRPVACGELRNWPWSCRVWIHCRRLHCLVSPVVILSPSEEFIFDVRA
jgi:hypothetical protein